MHIMLHLSHPPVADLHFAGLRINYTIHPNLQPRLSLVSKYVPQFEAAVAAHAYDIYSMAENDIAITWRNMQAMCREFEVKRCRRHPLLFSTATVSHLLQFSTLGARKGGWAVKRVGGKAARGLGNGMHRSG